VTIESVAKGKISNIFRWVKMFFPFVLLYIIWIACAFVSLPYVHVTYENQWVELAWIAFVFLIPFFLLPFVISAVLTKLGWTISTKKIHIKGFDFCPTRGPGRNVRKDVIPASIHKKHGVSIPDSEIQDYGSVMQIGMEGPYDVIYPVGCIEDDGIVATIEGNPHAYEPEQLPEPLRSRYIREKIDPVTGETDVQVIRKKKKVTLVLPALNAVTKQAVGLNFDHALIQTQQETINSLRENLRRLAKKYGEPTVIKEVERPQEAIIQQ